MLSPCFFLSACCYCCKTVTHRHTATSAQLLSSHQPFRSLLHSSAPAQKIILVIKGLRLKTGIQPHEGILRFSSLVITSSISNMENERKLNNGYKWCVVGFRGLYDSQICEFTLTHTYIHTQRGTHKTHTCVHTRINTSMCMQQTCTK